MGKVLRCVKMESCIGCGLCVLAASRVLKRTFSFSDSCITIKRNLKDKNNFLVEIDRGLCAEISEVAKICPENCFALVDGEED